MLHSSGIKAELTMTGPASASPPKSKPLFSEEGWNRHEIGKDARQLAGKLTRAVTVWKYFNRLETISKMVDSSDSV